MEFEWDEAKRKQNLAGHGVDFADVVWLDLSEAVIVADNRWNYGEDRFITYARLNGRMYVLCWTKRNNKMRIISFRKANDREQKLYSTSS